MLFKNTITRLNNDELIELINNVKITDIPSTYIVTVHCYNADGSIETMNGDEFKEAIAIDPDKMHTCDMALDLKWLADDIFNATKEVFNI